MSTNTKTDITASEIGSGSGLNSQRSNSISLCIPRVDSSYTKEYIRDVFIHCRLGNIDSIDVVPNHKENAKYNRVFVHYSDMTSEEGYLTRLLNGGSIKVVYEGPWYWKCMLSRVPRKHY